ncbi:DUF4432 domain-containing protein [Paenibacillus baekrokdamisoli]|uniref:DUF4432 domain-containing protein n=1 Tax=Paenibacillus baekrokdamisoli TaxID=1712516 RepID=A0A3G9IV45_9BACL|nr:DUF4432 family protein [Paenibacillus baekrokdamisoli]MBB3073336.1 hypothetical protein [Paenibacillus baekrokdamisoli]BBH22316.1 DUF4432 domain-containing protein [Paenibacillus baekrokdamisoli]
MEKSIKIHLESCSFERQETLLLEHGLLQASIFRYRSGVCGIRLTNPFGNLVILPYQGQQIWSMEFAGQSLAMQSVFDEPQLTRDFLSNYGGFMLHCGLLSLGSGPEDNHPVHGELPNAPYQQAFVRAGSDEQGCYLEVGGSYRHAIAFTCDYRAEPLIRLYETGTTVQISMEVTNLKSVPMEYMYLAHVNFRPADYGRLVYSAPCTADQVEVYRGLAAPFAPTPAYAAFVERVAQSPKIADVLDPSHVLNPELLMYFYHYIADREGWAHSMHIQPDGYAGYVKHRPEQLDKVVRWMARTGSEDALGFALPSTATPEGYTREKAKGNIRLLPAKGSVLFQVEAGLLSPEQAVLMERHITALLSGD